MSVKMTLHFPYDQYEENKFYIKDMLIPDQDYVFFGHIVDMSARSSEDNDIPTKPSMQVVQMTDTQIVRDVRGTDHVTAQCFYICKAGEFRKIEGTTTSKRNNAILRFLLDQNPEENIIIEMSW